MSLRMDNLANGGRLVESCLRFARIASSPELCRVSGLLIAILIHTASLTRGPGTGSMVYLSSIYTKTGDAGQTGLGDGTRVSKDHPRVAAYGSVDELNAVLGLLVA